MDPTIGALSEQGVQQVLAALLQKIAAPVVSPGATTSSPAATTSTLAPDTAFAPTTYTGEISHTFNSSNHVSASQLQRSVRPTVGQHHSFAPPPKRPRGQITQSAGINLPPASLPSKSKRPPKRPVPVRLGDRRTIVYIGDSAIYRARFEQGEVDHLYDIADERGWLLTPLINESDSGDVIQSKLESMLPTSLDEATWAVLSRAENHLSKKGLVSQVSGQLLPDFLKSGSELCLFVVDSRRDDKEFIWELQRRCNEMSDNRATFDKTKASGTAPFDKDFSDEELYDICFDCRFRMTWATGPGHQDKYGACLAPKISTPTSGDLQGLADSIEDTVGRAIDPPVTPAQTPRQSQLRSTPRRSASSKTTSIKADPLPALRHAPRTTRTALRAGLDPVPEDSRIANGPGGESGLTYVRGETLRQSSRRSQSQASHGLAD